MRNIVQRNKQLASSHSLSLILTLFFLLLLLNLSPLSFLSSSVLPLALAETLALVVSSQIKKGLTTFFLYDTAQPNLFWMNYASCHSWGDRKCIFMNVPSIFLFSTSYRSFLKTLLKCLLQKISLQDVYYKWWFGCDGEGGEHFILNISEFVINLGQFVEICLHFCFCFRVRSLWVSVVKK